MRAALLVLVIALARAPTAHAGGVPTLREWGLRAGGGGSPDTGVQYYALHPYLGLGVWKPAAQWLASHHVDALWIVEPWAAFVSDQEGRSRSDSFEIGVSPLFARFTFGDAALRPFVEGGFGILYTDLRSEVRARMDLGTQVQFSSQIGVGAEYALRPDLALTIAARYRHISNAGLSSDNPGIDTIYGLLGVTFR